MTPNQDGTWTYHVLHRFASYPTDGQMPGGALAMDKSGNCFKRGAARHGRGFQAQLHRRPLEENRGLTTFRIASTVAAQSLPRYLTKRATSIGEAAGGYNCGGGYCGTVWKRTPQKNGKWSYTLLHKFSPIPGSSPRVSLWTQRATCSALV
jgi:hypothetical protein